MQQQKITHSFIIVQCYGQVHDVNYIINTYTGYFVMQYVDGIPPDGTPIVIVNVLDWYVTFIGTLLMASAFVFILICLTFNIIFRNKK